MRVLFVCTGNVCRSPMAELIFKKLLKEKGIRTIRVESAGTTPASWLTLTEETQAALAEEGIKNADHQPKPITENAVKKSDYIFVMESHHLQYFESRYPDAENKVFLFKGFAGEKKNPEIADPFGKPLEFHRQTLLECKEAAKKVLKKIT